MDNEARIYLANAVELAHKLLQAADILGGEIDYDWKLNIYEFVKAFGFGDEVVTDHEAGIDPGSAWDLFAVPQIEPTDINSL